MKIHGSVWVRGMSMLACILLSLSIGGSSRPRYHLPSSPGKVLTGLDVLAGGAGRLRGKKAVLITNHSGLDSGLRRNIELLREKGIEISLIISPEHGLWGQELELEEKTSYEDAEARSTVYNIYRLGDEDLASILRSGDIVIFDIQDMGMRCYTYISNLKSVMDAMRGSGKELIVLDRPNPVGFIGVDGPYLEEGFYTKFISAFPAPFIYGMTMGEAAAYYRGEFAQDVNLKVVRMRNYRRGMLFTETGLPWIPPSPGLPTYESSIVYTSMVYLEGINISLGRGTGKPFEYIGAPWIEPVSFAKGLSALKLKNFRFRPVFFRPTYSIHKDQNCGGAHIIYTGGGFSPTEVAYRVIAHIKSSYKEVEWTRYGSGYMLDVLAGTDKFRKGIEEGKPFGRFKDETVRGTEIFKRKRRKYLLYD